MSKSAIDLSDIEGLLEKLGKDFGKSQNKLQHIDKDFAFDKFDDFLDRPRKAFQTSAAPSIIPYAYPSEPEGELETLINRYNRGRLQPRSGPPYMDSDMREGRMASFRRDSYVDRGRSKPSFGGKEVRDDLQNGRIPLCLHESYRLIDAEDPVSAAFQKKMEAITERLFKGNTGATTREFRFVLSDEDGAEACVLTGAKPPIIVVSKGAIEKFDTEDELAAVLAHELTHQHIFDRVGEHRNSNPEESSADAWAVKLLQDAGYNPNATLTMLEKIHPGHMRYRKSVLEAAEPHPSYETRRRHVEDVLAYLESKKPLNTELTPLDPTLKAAAASVHHTAFVPDWLEQHGYGAATAEEKVALLGRLWDEELLKLSFDEHKTRYDDFEAEVSSLAASVQDRPRLLDPLLTRVLMIQSDEGYFKSGLATFGYKSDRIESMFLTLSRGYKAYQDRSYGYTPIGNLADLKLAMKGFIEAQTREDAQMNAEVINEYAALTQSPIASHIRWPDFDVTHLITLDQELREGKSCALSWGKLQAWGETAPDIAQALGRFHINGAGAPQVPEDQRIIRKDIDWTHYGYTPDKHLDLDAEGNIKGHNIRRIKREVPKDVRFSSDYDDPYLRARDKEADELLPAVDWAAMKADFSGFVDKYREQLAPQITTSAGGDKFQKAFCDKCRQFLAEDPGKFGPLLEEFFAGDKSEKPEKERNRATFPALLAEFQRNYRVHPEVKVNRIIGKNGPTPPVQYGLSVDTPYLDLMSSVGVPLQDRFTLLAHMRWRTDSAKAPEDFIALDFRKILGYEKPASAAELYETIERLGEACKDKEYGAEREVYKALVNTEIYAYLALERQETLDIEKLYELAGQSAKNDRDLRTFFDSDFVLGFSHTSFVQKRDTIEEHANRFARLMDRQIEYLFADASNDAKQPEDLIRNYQVLSFGTAQRSSFFDRKPKERHEYETLLQRSVDKVDDPTRKAAMLRGLLCKSDLKDPEFRAWAVKGWIAAQGVVLNSRVPESDGGNRWAWPEGGAISAADVAKMGMEDIATDIIAHARMGQSVDMLNGLLEETRAQEADAFMVRDKLVHWFLRRGTAGNLAAAANDFVLERIGEEKKVRDKLLNFLTSPLSAKTINAFMKAMTDPKLEHKYSQDIFYIFQNDKDDRGIDIPGEMRINALQNVYKNFWALPFAARALYIERVLFPVGEDSQEKFDKAITYAMNKILPQGQPYMDHARLILTTHLEQCSKPLQRLTYAALITASEKRDDDASALRPGQILSQVLSKSGAAGGKILQAIHSYLQSIPDAGPDLVALRDDLQSSKSNYNKPFRWDVIKRVKDCYKPRDGKPAPTVGRQLGAGSYGYTVELVYPNAATALTLAREDVAEESRYQFGIFKKTAEKLAQVNRMWKPLIGILGNAQEMSAVESDFEIAAKQIKVAETLYNGLKVSVDGYNFNISTAGLQNFGKEFKETELAKGEHFLDLPGGTDDEKKYRKAVARAVLTAELHVWLRGGPFDYDRHGAQCRVQGGEIKLFDHGSIPYDIAEKKVFTPSAQDKALLGKVIAASYAEAQVSGASVTDTLIEKLTQTESYGGSARYLECFKRGMLALSDYIKDAGDTPAERNKFIVAAIRQSVGTGLADTHIVSSLAGAMGAAANKPAVGGEIALTLKDKRSNGLKRAGSLLALVFNQYAKRPVHQLAETMGLKAGAPGMRV